MASTPIIEHSLITDAPRSTTVDSDADDDTVVSTGSQLINTIKVHSVQTNVEEDDYQAKGFACDIPCLLLLRKQC